MSAHVVDRTGWGAGPWTSEPEDRVDFVHAGFACFVQRGGGGAWCGYVGLPVAHPWSALDGEAIPADVHGGLSYGPAPCGGAICHVPPAGYPHDVRWIGFDCSHCDDLRPAYPEWDFGREAVYRDLAYVRAETERLAEQAAAVRS